MKNTTKRILLVSTFMLTASHAANPVDSTNTPSTTAATPAAAAVPTMLNQYPQLDYKTPLREIYKTITDCLTEYDYAMHLESQRNEPGLADQAAELAAKIENLAAKIKSLEVDLSLVRTQEGALALNIASAAAEMKAKEKYRYTKEEDAERRGQQTNIETMKQNQKALKASNSSLCEEIQKTKRDLAIASRSVPSKLIQRYAFLSRAASQKWNSLPAELLFHNKMRLKEVAEVNGEIRDALSAIQSAEAILVSENTSPDDRKKAQLTFSTTSEKLNRLEKKRNDTMAIIVETPAILNYLIQFSNVMRQQIQADGQEPTMLSLALGDWGTHASKRTFSFNSEPIDVGSPKAKATWDQAPFFGNNTLELKGQEGVGIPNAPTFEQVLEAAREFVENPFGRAPEQATNGSESGPAAA